MKMVDASIQSWPLHGRRATQALEQSASEGLQPHALMQRAGLAVAKLALALAPHARTIWIACGPGNNGGDGALAAVHLTAWGKRVVLTGIGDPARAPPDALAAWQQAARAGQLPQRLSEDAPQLEDGDICIDALLGVGASRAPEGEMARCIALLNVSAAAVLAIDLPSGLDADTGSHAGSDAARARGGDNWVRAHWTLSLLTLKPGLFTSLGRDAAGEVWFDDLGVQAGSANADAQLNARSGPRPRPHASHKGSYGDLAVVGGAPGMLGAAVLAATAALHGGSGRVFLCALQPMDAGALIAHPELMPRALEAMDPAHTSVVCGCGGGDAVHAVLPRLLSRSRALVLDADALNAIARDSALQSLLLRRAASTGQVCTTVLTPHPLEAARLLGSSTTQVQANRLQAARDLAQRFRCVVVLKGSGTVIAASGQLPAINATGNARLASAGTGDVLAGMIGARLAQGQDAFSAACAAVYEHGFLADRWPLGSALTAGALAKAVGGNPPTL